MNDEVRCENALVTGGTDGIGKEVALGLARAGHRVVVIGRDPQKGVRAAREIHEATGNPNIKFIRADLSLMSETKRVADEVASNWTGLHYLVHSAGIVRTRREVTKEGVECNFAINYLSRFVLTQRLLPLMKAAGQPGDAARNGRDFPWWMKVFVPLVMDPLLRQTAEEAAESALRLLLAGEYEGITGALFLKIRKFKQIAPAAGVTGPGVRRRLWELSERLSAVPLQSQNSISAA